MRCCGLCGRKGGRKAHHRARMQHLTAVNHREGHHTGGSGVKGSSKHTVQEGCYCGGLLAVCVGMWRRKHRSWWTQCRGRRADAGGDGVHARALGVQSTSGGAAVAADAVAVVAAPSLGPACCVLGCIGGEGPANRLCTDWHKARMRVGLVGGTTVGVEACPGAWLVAMGEAGVDRKW
eukprot:1161297-Pelagomonas_calceolata.AAC.4